jgi:hypothetical protein
VDEEEWLTGTDPEAMLAFLRDKGSERKLRLFACACCRRIRDFLPTDACLQGVEVAERYADSAATGRERSSALSAVIASAEEEGITLFGDLEAESIEWGAVPGGLAFMAVVEVLGGRTFEVARAAMAAASEAACDASRHQNGIEAARSAFKEDYALEQAAQALILRDLFGNPFRPASLNPAWLWWNDGTLPGMAQRIYAERDFSALPILADALEDGGCGDLAILEHCRRPGEHYRGCFVVDAIVGRW